MENRERESVLVASEDLIHSISWRVTIAQPRINKVHKYVVQMIPSWQGRMAAKFRRAHNKYHGKSI